MKKHKKSLGVYLTYILRHAPESIGLDMDTEGWVNIQDFIEKSAKLRAFNYEELLHEVKNDTKSRFEISANHRSIRCVQGHSIDSVKLELKPVTKLIEAFHGTTTLNAIRCLQEGINKQSRNHVHLSRDIETAQTVGARHKGIVAILRVNTQAMINDGLSIFEANNGVILTDYVAPQYIATRSFSAR